MSEASAPMPLRARLIVRELVEMEGTPIDPGHRRIGEKHRALLKAAASLVAAALDGMSNERRVNRVRKALEIIDC